MGCAGGGRGCAWGWQELGCAGRQIGVPRASVSLQAFLGEQPGPGSSILVTMPSPIPAGHWADCLGTGGWPWKSNIRWGLHKPTSPRAAPSWRWWPPAFSSLPTGCSWEPAGAGGRGEAGRAPAAPRCPQPPRPTPGWCSRRHQPGGSWQRALPPGGHRVSLLPGAASSASVSVPVCTGEENGFPLGNELPSGVGPPRLCCAPHTLQGVWEPGGGIPTEVPFVGLLAAPLLPAHCPRSCCPPGSHSTRRAMSALAG